ncbi:hypothetical protein RDI58_015453 [Solanum bulbocastanum]|uniref:DUF7081 domain-containing protein n=1 Tax=Solanum bulbocastanum TaxID=147425 RepID=A0AAN8YF04_SOLBU
MSGKEEVGESLALVVYNGRASTINETGLQLYPVSEYDSSEGLPYAPMDWPNLDDSFKQSLSSKVSLVFAETVAVYFAVSLSVWTMMGTITFDVKQQ